MTEFEEFMLKRLGRMTKLLEESSKLIRALSSAVDTIGDVDVIMKTREEAVGGSIYIHLLIMDEACENEKKFVARRYLKEEV